MKKYLLVLLAFLLGTIPAQAQQQTNAPVVCAQVKYTGASKPAVAVIETLAATCGYQVVYANNYVPSAMVRLEGEFSNLSHAVNEMASQGSFVVEVDEVSKTITVHQLHQGDFVAPPTPSSGRREAVEDLLARYPQAYNPDGTMGSFRQNRQLREELTLQHSRPNPVSVPSYERGSYRESYPLSFFGGYESEVLGHSIVQRQIDQDTWGALKFKKGRETFMANVEVWGCNQRLVQADEANNIWDKKVLVPVNCRPLTFRYSDGKDDWEVEIDEMIVPMRLQNSKDITLDQAFFNRARKRTKYQMYDFLEQPDGSFRKVPRQ